MENLAIDHNSRNVAGGITNDSNEFIKNLRINPVTGRLLVDANITSTNTSIGSTIPGGTAGSVLFLGAGSTLDQDNAHFFYDATNHFLGLGTDTPAETLDVEGTLRFNDGSAVTGYVLTATDGLGNATWEPSNVSGSGITSINADTTVAQILSDAVGGFITIVDSGSGTHTFAVDISGLANSTTFISDLTSNTTFKSDIITIVNGGGGSVQINLTTQVTGVLPIAHGGTDSSTALSGSSIMISDGTHIIQGAKGTTTTVLHGNAAGAPTYSAVNLATDVTGLLSASNIDITNLESTLNLANIAGQIDLTTQVSGILPLANGGTQTALSDPGFDAIYIWDEIDGATSLSTIGSGLSYDHSTHTLSAQGSGNKLAIVTTQSSSSNGTPVIAYTVNIPGGTLGTNNAIRATLLGVNGGAEGTIQFSYGGTNYTAIVYGGSAVSSFNATCQFILTANGATNAQIGETIGTNDIISTGVSQINIAAQGSSTIDSTTNQDLVVTIHATNSFTSAISTNGIIVEII